MLSAFWRIFQFFFWPAFVGVLIWGLTLSVPEYKMYKFDYHVQEAEKEMTFTRVGNEKTTNIDETLQHVAKAAEHYESALYYAMTEQDTTAVIENSQDVADSFEGLVKTKMAEAAILGEKKIIAKYENFGNQLSRFVDQLNKHDSRTKKKK